MGSEWESPMTIEQKVGPFSRQAAEAIRVYRGRDNDERRDILRPHLRGLIGLTLLKLASMRRARRAGIGFR